MQIRRATDSDIPAVRDAYEHARQRQRELGSSVWLDFPDALIREEINSGLLWCVFDGAVRAGVFTIAYADPIIWGERERGAHIYVHRIARTADYSGSGLFAAILSWARAECRALGREAVRMDTWASNAALVAYYCRQGFEVVARRWVGPDARLPAHYTGFELALLEDATSPFRAPD